MPKLNINEIALAAHVTSAHVMQVLYNRSHTLNPDEVARILTVVRKSGLEEQFYALTNRSHAIGVFISGEFEWDFVNTVAMSVADAAQQHGFSLEFNFRRNNKPVQPQDFLDLIGNKGAIIIASNDSQIIVETCRIHNCPYVLVESEYRQTSSAGVEIVTSNQQSTADAVNYLLELGHRKFAYLTGDLDNQSVRERLDGYQTTLHAAGISYDPDLLIETDWTMAEAYHKSKSLFAHDNQPTAICCANDLIAIGAIQAAQEAGLVVGRDVSIVGFDDIKAAIEVSPQLTTLRQPMTQMGEVAFAELFNLMNGREPSARHVMLPAELVIRESTGPAPV